MRSRSCKNICSVAWIYANGFKVRSRRVLVLSSRNVCHITASEFNWSVRNCVELNRIYELSYITHYCGGWIRRDLLSVSKSDGANRPIAASAIIMSIRMTTRNCHTTTRFTAIPFATNEIWIASIWTIAISDPKINWWGWRVSYISRDNVASYVTTLGIKYCLS